MGRTQLFENVKRLSKELRRANKGKGMRKVGAAAPLLAQEVSDLTLTHIQMISFILEELDTEHKFL